MPTKGGGLTAQGVRNAGPGVYGDGGGLYLRVKPDGRAAWTLRYQIAGKRRDLGLGRAKGVGAVSLAEARQKAADARRMVDQGRDPLDVRDAEAASCRAAEAASARMDISTFQAVADDFLAAREAGWKNDKHRLQWDATLRTYAFPLIGTMPVDQIGTADVLRVLRPIWEVKPETAGRVRGRIEAILGYAAALDHRPKGHNPASWRGNLDATLPPLAKMKTRVREVAGRAAHHPALPWERMPEFMRAVAARDGAAALALRFAILTAARTSEVIGATWAEVNEAGRLWTVPASRMKGGAEHRAPLSEAALTVLAEAAERSGGRNGPVFQSTGRRLTDMALTMAVRRMQGDGKPRWTDVGGRPVTVHGFRSTFRDWAGERTDTPREVAEAALAHTVGNKVEAAYRRGDALEKRRSLMEQWAAWCAGDGSAEVLPLRRSGAA